MQIEYANIYIYMVGAFIILGFFLWLSALILKAKLDCAPTPIAVQSPPGILRSPVIPDQAGGCIECVALHTKKMGDVLPPSVVKDWTDAQKNVPSVHWADDPMNLFRVSYCDCLDEYDGLDCSIKKGDYVPRCGTHSKLVRNTLHNTWGCQCNGGYGGPNCEVKCPEDHYGTSCEFHVPCGPGTVYRGIPENYYYFGSKAEKGTCG